MTLTELLEEFESLVDWEDRCEYLIELGFELPKLPPGAKMDENRVRGCQSSVWLIAETKDTTPQVVEFHAESDAMLVNGLIAVLLVIFSGKTPQEILETDVKSIFGRLGLERHLSTARKNGLYGMVNRIRAIAEQAV